MQMNPEQHEQYMEKVKAGISQAINILQGLTQNSENSEEAANSDESRENTLNRFKQYFSK